MGVQRRGPACFRRGLGRAAVALTAVMTLGGAIRAAPPAESRTSAAALPADDLFDQIFAEGQKKFGNLETVTASFVETTTSALLIRPLVAKGHVVVERPSRVSVTYTEPDARRILIDGDRLTMSWPAKQLHQVTDIGANQKRVRKYFVDSSPSELRSHFTIAASETSERPGTWAVTMIPKRKQIQEGLSKLEIWISRSTLLMDAMRITFPNGDTKLMTFTDVRANVPVDPQAFAETTR